MNELEQSLLRWAQAGLVSAEQAQQIREFEQDGESVSASVGEAVTEQAKSERVAVATEAVAYIGGMLFLIGFALLVGSQWGSLNDIAHFTVAFVPAIITFVAGIGFGRHTVASFQRIGYALWALSTGFLALSAGTFAEAFLPFDDRVDISIVATVVMAFAVGQYVFRRSALQQLLSFAAIAFFTCSLLALIDDSIPTFWFGSLVVAQGLAWLLFTWADVIRPRRDGFIQGAGGALLSTQFMVFSMTDPAIGLGIALSLLFVLIGVLTSTTVLFTLGAIGLFAFAYEGVLTWFGSSVLTNAILLTVGAIVLGAVVVRLQLKGRS
jgi:hypothetical protein